MSNYGKSRFYRITDINFDPLESIKFQKGTLVDYYFQRYQVQIKDLKQPLFVTEGRDK